MKAIAIERFGGSGELKMMDLPTPEPEKGEVLVELAYSGVNPVDWKIREGYLQGLLPHKFPLILGWEGAGTVREVGGGVTGWRRGDAVFAYCRKPEVQWGTYAEYVAVDAAAVARMPKKLSFRDAAGVPLTALTAWQALFEFAALAPGQLALIHAGAGGVGGIAIQLAKHQGAVVYTTASAGNHSYVRELGADLAIDYRSDDVAAAIEAKAPGGVDVVLDAVGGDVLRRSYSLVKPGGVLVSIVDPPDEAMAKKRGIRAGFVFVRPDGAQLSEIGQLFAAGTLRPLFAEEMPLSRAAAAQDKIRAGHTRGKIVLAISGK